MSAVLTAESLAEAAQSLPSSELDKLAHKLSMLRAHRRAPALPPEEADLLQRIASAVPLSALQQRKILQALGKERLLSLDETVALAQLTDQVELAEAVRIDLLSELATLRGITLPEVARQLGLTPS
jgi:hypothetical protein